MVSVIITTYNRKKFLFHAVNSVIQQDFQDKEIIVVDDGSVDKSYEIVKDLPVRYVWKPNGGISSARNAGIRLSRGDYIAFLDVDDLWLKNKLSIQMEAMIEKDYPVSYTDEIWLKNHKRINQRQRHRKYSGHIFDRCLPLCIISPSSVVIKREVFDTIGLFDESLPVCEDYDMWLRLSSRYPVLFIDRPLIIKNGGHEDQLSKRYEVMDRFRIKSLVKLLDSNTLDMDMREKAIGELERKCHIVARGAIKRGRFDEAKTLMKLVVTYKKGEKDRGQEHLLTFTKHSDEMD
ncbi:MAG TPA: glycosyltransferase [Syntrophorhabdaceae bacterium]|nr:glycosyltransferase [Syntrophorhabdaceae bacterium]